MCYVGSSVTAIVVLCFYVGISFDIVGVGTRGRHKYGRERSHNAVFNETVMSQTVTAKILGPGSSTACYAGQLREP
jgi:hypothetical protein